MNTTPPPLTVSQLTQAIKLSLESTFPLIHLQGELTNLKLQTSGHLYFSLQDAQAQISAVMFKSDVALLKALPKTGDQVIIKGELTVYPPKGNYQLVVRELSLMGIGELLLKLEQLKIKLHQLGWFKSGRKKALPRFPRCIGVVTSPTGAVIQDIINVLTRRFSGFHLILNPVKVQGEGAAQEIAKAIDQFNKTGLVDVMIIGRGGGSVEDLWAFNEEIVAEAIFRSQIPIISAVGHETDHCIADYVADVRAPTPSAAAELVIAEKAQQLEKLLLLRKQMQQHLSHRVQHHQLRLMGFKKHPYFIHPKSMVELRMQKLDEMRTDLEQSALQVLNKKKHQLALYAQQVNALNPSSQILHFRQRLVAFKSALFHNIKHQLGQFRQKVDFKNQTLTHQGQLVVAERKKMFHSDFFSNQLSQTMNKILINHKSRFFHICELLKAVDPKRVLEKGYSILFAEKSAFVINSVSQLKKGQTIQALLSDGEVEMIVK